MVQIILVTTGLKVVDLVVDFGELRAIIDRLRMAFTANRMPFEAPVVTMASGPPPGGKLRPGAVATEFGDGPVDRVGVGPVGVDPRGVINRLTAAARAFTSS
jgi:hypothetical protein